MKDGALTRINRMEIRKSCFVGTKVSLVFYTFLGIIVRVL